MSPDRETLVTRYMRLPNGAQRLYNHAQAGYFANSPCANCSTEVCVCPRGNYRDLMRLAKAQMNLCMHEERLSEAS